MGGFVLIWNRFTAEAEGFASRKVDPCARCGLRFEYTVPIVGLGVGRSLYTLDDEGAKRRAVRAAEKDLHRRESEGVLPMPCPHCGDYQPEMLRHLKQLRYPYPLNRVLNTLILAVILIATVAGVVLLLVSGDSQLGRVLGGMFIIGSIAVAIILGAVFAVQGIGRHSHDPHRFEPLEKRLARAKRYCVAPGHEAKPPQ